MYKLLIRMGAKKILDMCSIPLDRQIEARVSELVEEKLLNIHTTPVKYVTQDNSYVTDPQKPNHKGAGY
jgi:hypothetical protein